MSEIWKPIPGYEGIYEASPWGRVRSVDRVDQRGNRLKGKILRPGMNKKGYLHTNFYKNGQLKNISIHLVVALAFIGPKPKGHEVNHKNGEKADNRPENLEYVTPKENTRHKFETLGYKNPRGERHPRSKLTDAQAQEIRRRAASGNEKQEDIAQDYGVTKYMVSLIHTRKTWSHV